MDEKYKLTKQNKLIILIANVMTVVFPMVAKPNLMSVAIEIYMLLFSVVGLSLWALPLSTKIAEWLQKIYKDN